MGSAQKRGRGNTRINKEFSRMCLDEELETHRIEGELEREEGLDLKISIYFFPG